MKITSAEALEALKRARGDRSWSQFAATAPRASDGVILLRGPARQSPNHSRSASLWSKLAAIRSLVARLRSD